MGRVFISYRREDSSDVTGRIYDRLVGQLGSGQVFKDVDSIPLGVDFRRHIREAVEQCDVVLVVIGPRWDSSADTSGARRIDDSADFVHLEIRAALERGIPVIPILVGHAAIPREEELPEPLRELAFRNAMSVRPDPDFHRDMDRLLAALGRQDDRGKEAASRVSAAVAGTGESMPARGDFRHDVFLSFASEDKAWTIEKLYRPLLECTDLSGAPVRVALDWKDSEVDLGRRSLKELDEALAASRRIVVVVSERYIERSMCRWRLMKMAQFESAEERVMLLFLDPQPSSDEEALSPEWLEIRGVEGWMSRALNPRSDGFFEALCLSLGVRPR